MILKNVLNTRGCIRRFSTSIIRQERELFVRDEKISVNIGTVGTSLHGKTQLASLFTKVLNKSHNVPIKEMSEIDNAGGEKKFGSSQFPTHLELWDDKFRINLTDLPGHSSYQRNTLTILSGLDAVLFVINPDEGIMPDMVEMYHICQHLQIICLPVIFKRSGTDNETVDLVLMELEEMDFTETGMIVEGLDNHQSVHSFFNNLDLALERANITRDTDSKFYLPMEQVGLIPNRGTFCAGRVKSGKCKVGNTLEAFFHGQKSRGTVKDMEIFRKKTDLLQAGDRGGFFIKFKPDIDLKRGGVVYEPGAEGQISASWKVDLKSLQSQEPIKPKGEFMMYHSTFSDGKVKIDECQLEGDRYTEAGVHISYPIMAQTWDPVIIKNNHITLVGNLISPLSA